MKTGSLLTVEDHMLTIKYMSTKDESWNNAEAAIKRNLYTATQRKNVVLTLFQIGKAIRLDEQII